MANLSWQFYKGYYKEFKHWDNLDTKDEKIKKDIEVFFSNKNSACTSFSLSDAPLPSLGNSQLWLFTTYPGLLIGSGYTHEVGSIGEFKIGFQLDYTTGLPIIPGSSVKGILRSVFPEIEVTVTDRAIEYSYNNEEIDIVKTKWMTALIKHIDDDNFLKNYYPPQEAITEDEKIAIFLLTSQIFDGIRDHTKTKNNEKFLSIYERDVFNDAYPIKGNDANKILGTDSITPHGDNPLKNPVPLLFLKVLPMVCFQFNFDLKDGILTKTQKLNLFKKILLTIGIGAKTNVGYGQFSETSMITPKEPDSDQQHRVIQKNFSLNKETFKKGQEVKMKVKLTGKDFVFITGKESEFIKSKDSTYEKFKEIAEKKGKDYEELKEDMEITIRFNADVNTVVDMANFTVLPAFK